MNMKKIALFIIVCLVQTSLFSQDFDMAIDKKNEKEFERAVELFNYLISLYPGSEFYQYVLRMTYLQKGDVELAKASFNESLLACKMLNASQN
jgi:hypothetical protein